MRCEVCGLKTYTKELHKSHIWYKHNKYAIKLRYAK